MKIFFEDTIILNYFKNNHLNSSNSLIRTFVKINNMASCPICSGSQTLKIYNDTLIQCKECTHIWADLSLNEEELRKIYAENYFKGEEYANYLSDKLILQSNFTKRLKSLKKLTTAPTFESVLE